MHMHAYTHKHTHARTDVHKHTQLTRRCACGCHRLGLYICSLMFHHILSVHRVFHMTNDKLAATRTSHFQARAHAHIHTHLSKIWIPPAILAWTRLMTNTELAKWRNCLLLFLIPFKVPSLPVSLLWTCTKQINAPHRWRAIFFRFQKLVLEIVISRYFCNTVRNITNMAVVCKVVRQ
jgi:hypothetical protein